MKIKAGISAVLMAAFILLAGITPAQAKDNCEKKMQKAENNLRKEIKKHGERSSQAEYRRRQLEQVREQCGRDHDRDHDRDHHDHDHDHDHR